MIIKTQKIGQYAEEQALHYLRQQQLILVERNFRCRLGEIDLIMRDKTSYVFVEVRYRRSTDYGESFETVTITKKKKIIRATAVYLQQRKLYENVPCRFDVVALTGNLQAPVIQWIKDAFQLY